MQLKQLDRKPSMNAVSPVELVSMFSRAQLDRAIDRAARLSAATVALFIAAPLELASSMDGARIEFAVEFFVPPVSLSELEAELDRALMQESAAYKAARRSGRALSPMIQLIPAGAFHQWRLAWNFEDPIAANERWSAHRHTMESLLHQIRVGFRELLAI